MALITANLRELKALVVDDSRTARRIIQEILNEIPVAHVETAEDGADAIAKLRAFAADIVICDLHMVPLDGIEFTRLLRGAHDSPNPYLPVLMLTADATEAQLKNAMGAGVNEFMSKPVKMAALRRKIHDIFTRPRVYLRDGRYVKPLRAARADDQKTETAEEPELCPVHPAG